MDAVSRRERFRHWRHTRPFWGCLLSLIFAGELYAATAAPMGLVVLQGVTVLGTILVSSTLAILAFATLAQPLLRTITGPLIVLLALVSLLVSNFGGFVIGMLVGMIGGGMIFGWSPTKNAVSLAGFADGEAEPIEAEDQGSTPRSHLLAWLLPMIAVAMVVAGAPPTPAVAQSPTGAPADFPCLIPLLCRSPSPTPSPESPPTPGLTPSSTPMPIPLPSASSKSPSGLFPAPKATAVPTPTTSTAATCDPADLPKSDGTPVGAIAALVARVLQACAKPGNANPGTADEIATVANQPSVLKADRLELAGLTYHGTVKLKTATGTTTVMDFSATKLTIVGMNLSLPFNTQTIQLNGTNTATISGNVRLYASDLSGKVFNLLPLTFTANPPPLLPELALPTLFFTGATSHVALVSANSIKTAIAIDVS